MNKPLIILLVTVVLLFSGCSSQEKKQSSDDNISSETQETSSVKSASTNLDMQPDSTVPKTSNQPTQKEYSSLVLYYQDGEGTIIPVARKLPKQEGIAKATLYGLIDSAATREEIDFYGVYPVLPEGTEILGLSISEGIATVDFSDKLLNYTNILAEKNIISSVVYTLTEFDNINGVQFMIKGKKQGKLKYGSDLSGVYTRDNLMLNTESFIVSQDKDKVDVFLVKQINNTLVYYVPVSYQTDKVEEKDLPVKVIEFLKKGNSTKKLFTNIVPESVLLKSSLENGTLSLYFDKAFRNYGGTAWEDSLLKQLFYSMQQIKGVEKLRIFVDNLEGNLPEGSDITGGYSFSNQINNVIDK